MRQNTKNRKNGFTLVELLLVSAILGIIIMVTSGIIIYSYRVQRVSYDEYELQTTMRLAAEETNKVVRYSSAIFTIPEGRFFEGNLSDGWNYFGLSADKREVIKYVYEERGGVTKHWKEVVVPAQDNLEYSIVFDKENDDPEDRMMKFKIIGTVLGTTDRRIIIESEVESINALQVVDRGTASNLAVALAYRYDERPKYDVVGVVTMVIDTSGSMGDDLQGHSYVTESSKRISKLKNALVGYTKDTGEVVEGMINSFAKDENVEVSIVPFSISANYPTPSSEYSSQSHPFYKVSNPSEKSALISQINSLSANGGTNTGDGMRRAYYRNMYFKNNVTSMSDYGANFSTRDYMIILVDGVTTMATSVGGYGDSRYRMTDGYQSNLNYYSNSYYWSYSGIIGRGNAEDAVTDRYVELIGNYIRNDGIKVYVIGFSEIASELNSVNKIATAAGADSENVYKFTDNLDIDNVLDEIRADIMMDLWHIRGPQL